MISDSKQNNTKGTGSSIKCEAYALYSKLTIFLKRKQKTQQNNNINNNNNKRSTTHMWFMAYTVLIHCLNIP